MKISQLNKFGICIDCECSMEEERVGKLWCAKCQEQQESTHTGRLST